jgi:glycerol-3-phosphate acyltransferase PlsY
MFQTDLNPFTVLISVILGYSIGAISFARIITRWRAPQLDISHTDIPVPGTENKIRMNGIGATSVIIQVGQTWGMLTGFLDGFKVFAPALVLRLLFPSEPYFLIFAAMCVIGHDWPVYYGFRGGYGLAAICGGILVADWPILLSGLLILAAIATIATAISRRLHISIIIGTLALLPWFWLRTHDWWYIIYSAVVSLAYIIRVIPEMKAFNRAQSDHIRAHGHLNSVSYRKSFN